MPSEAIAGEIPAEKLTGPLRRASVKKNVAAIHVSGKLTLLQRKLSNVLLLNAYDDLATRPTHRIDARTLCLMIGYNSNDMETLKASLRGLAETVAEWDMLGEDGQQEWGVSALLSYAKLKAGICEYAYSPALAAKLHDPKVFALINLNIQRRFASGHALALYENCYRFVRTGSTGWWDLGLFRRLMGVDGSSYYETYKHLNAKIIKPAVTEVNKTSNILVTPEVRKLGRTVTDIRFKIKSNPQLAMVDMDAGDAVRHGAVYDSLRSLGVSDRLARQWISEHGEGFVAEKLAYVGRQAHVKSPVRYLTAAIRDGFSETADDSGQVKPSAEQVLVAAVRRVDEEAREEAEKARDAALSEERRDRAARMARVRDAAAARTPTQRDADKRLFLSGLKDPLEREDFGRFGWGSALNARAIFAFWLEMQPGIFDGL
ncbi:replication initiation protein [Meridianimarinicoccus aquatilis]|uniref:RepB family plasmid replication initiator protein n=1 Tax=Meridianimarinicoccus aquatilis TaxID=2552766 RepID=A0A4R6B315_9RHOB|nr:replication initiation protein [Fluviibacterium aquatile]QIE42995.1 replication initiation protein [Rhodobacteraceae bacterium SC52]TDL88983.1 RepB family plasmid replication initiator protein [Fluviibacterium aquatile]